MNPRGRTFAVTLCVFLYTSAFSAEPFHWQWQKMETDSFWQRPVIRQIHDDRLRQSIVDAVTDALGEFDGVSNAELQDIAANESYEWTDLDGDGVPELITGGFGVKQCGGTGSCSLQVFRRHGSEFDLVLETTEQQIMIDRSGHKPLLVLYNGTPIQGELEVYSFPHNSQARKVHDYTVTWIERKSQKYAVPHLE